jgi:hypothetical protein
VHSRGAGRQQVLLAASARRRCKETRSEKRITDIY